MKANKPNRKVYLFTTLCWLSFILTYACYYVASIMTQSAIKPDPDTYVNNVSFQVIAFIYTHGLLSLVMLGLALLLEIWLIEEPIPSIK